MKCKIHKYIEQYCWATGKDEGLICEKCGQQIWRKDNGKLDWIMGEN